MRKLVEIERTLTPSGEMVLYQRDEEFSIRVGGVELMNSHNHGSEDDLGQMSCERLAGIAAPRVLIGGCGLGYTLRAALDHLPPAARIDLVEIVPAVLTWNRTVVAHLAGQPLADPRVTAIEGDVVEVIRSATARYDTIILDIDNGPDGLSKGNSALYRMSGLASIHAALVPGGLCTVWSSFESPTFTSSLRSVGFEAEVRRIKARHRGGPRHYIWFAQRRRPRSATR